MKEIQELNKTQMDVSVRNLGWKPYRSRQILRWLYKKNEFNVDRMTDIPERYRTAIKQEFFCYKPPVIRSQKAEDDTKKLQLMLKDGHSIETVFMPYEDRSTVCISTQVGCAMGCRFCATGKMGLIRNLSASEIFSQLKIVQREFNDKKDKKPVNIVLMGMGEPLHNFANVIKALTFLLADWGFDWSKRRITLSTCGLIPQLEALGKLNLGINLSVSLNASDDKTRSLLMPVNIKYPLDQLMNCLRRYPLAKRQRITFEYILIKGINDSYQAAKKLIRILHGIKSKINLIPYNTIPEFKSQQPSQKDILTFQNILIDSGYSTFIRESKGSSISAACGQLVTRKPDI